MMVFDSRGKSYHILETFSYIPIACLARSKNQSVVAGWIESSNKAEAIVAAASIVVHPMLMLLDPFL